MKSTRKTAIIVGVLFISATVTSSLYYVFVTPILNAPDYLVKFTENANQAIIGVLFYLVDCAAVVAIPIMLYPIFKKYNERLALGYVGARIIESVTLIVGNVSSLSLLALSREYVQTAVTNAPQFQASGTLLLAVHDWTHLIGVEIVFSIGALILNYILYKSKLVLRFVSVWGFIGAILLLAFGLLHMFGFSPISAISMIFTLPIAINEMVLAIWLIAKGFNLSAIASESAK
jgi:hypothetical protein